MGPGRGPTLGQRVGEVGGAPTFNVVAASLATRLRRVVAALLVGSDAPRDGVLELAAEVQGPRRVVQRLAGTIMWDRASPAATAVAKPVVEARPQEIAWYSYHHRYSRRGSSGECGSSGPRADSTTSADDSTVARACGEAHPPGIAVHGVSTASDLAVSSGVASSARPDEKDTLQQSQGLLVKFGFIEAQYHSRIRCRSVL